MSKFNELLGSYRALTKKADQIKKILGEMAYNEPLYVDEYRQIYDFCTAKKGNYFTVGMADYLAEHYRDEHFDVPTMDVDVAIDRQEWHEAAAAFIATYITEK